MNNEMKLEKLKKRVEIKKKVMRRSEAKTVREKRKLKRIKRRNTLIKYGLLLEALDLLEEENMILFGFFSRYEKLLESDRIKLFKIGKEIYQSEVGDKINKVEIRTKERAHQLILKATLFEPLGLLKEEKTVVCGFLSRFNQISKKNKEKLFKIGEIKWLELKTIKNPIEKSEILELFKLADNKNIDLIVEMWKKLKIRNIELLTKGEYQIMKSHLENSFDK